jgi:hypothetical protein
MDEQVPTVRSSDVVTAGDNSVGSCIAEQLNAGTRKCNHHHAALGFRYTGRYQIILDSCFRVRYTGRYQIILDSCFRVRRYTSSRKLRTILDRVVNFDTILANVQDKRAL